MGKPTLCCLVNKLSLRIYMYVHTVWSCVFIARYLGTHPHPIFNSTWFQIFPNLNKRFKCHFLLYCPMQLHHQLLCLLNFKVTVCTNQTKIIMKISVFTFDVSQNAARRSSGYKCVCIAVPWNVLSDHRTIFVGGIPFNFWNLQVILQLAITKTYECPQ